MYKLLDTINGPADIKNLKEAELVELAEEIRRFLLETVSRTGGHLASNLGCVELTLALHYCFDSPGTNHLGRGTPGLHPQDSHRPSRQVSHPAPVQGHQRLSQALRVPP